LLRSWILRKQARADVDVDALIEKRLVTKSRQTSDELTASNPQARRRQGSKRRLPSKRTGRHDAQTSQTDEDSRPSSASDTPSSDSVVDHNIRRRRVTRTVSGSFKVALRLYRKTLEEERASLGPCYPYSTIFLTDHFCSAADCFTKLGEYVGTKLSYVEFHPPEDMSLESRICVKEGSEEADSLFERVMTMLREARSFPGEPSYRTIEAEIGLRAISEN
jgi:hypothetical protein